METQSDNTQEIIGRYQKQYKNLRYIKAPSKGGIDLDMSKSVSYVNSKYCWLFSADDICIPGALTYVLDKINAHQPDLMLFRHNECEFDIQILENWPVLVSSIDKETLFGLSDQKDLVRYCSAAQTSEAFFSFMGSLVIKRKKWFEIALDTVGKNTNWAHITRLWCLTGQPFQLLYFPEVWLSRRGGKDSFSSDGSFQRLKLQVYGLQSAIAKATSNPVILSNLKRVIKQEIYPR